MMRARLYLVAVTVLVIIAGIGIAIWRQVRADITGPSQSSIPQDEATQNKLKSSFSVVQLTAEQAAYVRAVQAGTQQSDAAMDQAITAATDAQLAPTAPPPD